MCDFFSLFLLLHLCVCVILAKRFREPPGVRRPWQVWWYDTSKQGIGAIVIHLTNVYLAKLFQGDPCTWYVINFLLDSTIGLLIVFIGIRLCQFLAYYKKWPAINFGVYGMNFFRKKRKYSKFYNSKMIYFFYRHNFRCAKIMDIPNMYLYWPNGFGQNSDNIVHTVEILGRC